ncbi:MAG: DUF3038 domain-containing protein [Hydrococcus sp. C42_A2020_068]|uniref:DUF3038 domain-containing protein n=1 Tax=Pleurocapsa sp. PCC 7327 TaxID=118163 RepID=UPI00029FFEFA|nr:DUF3038 domain-containing protein [Pleurocapsa sp. PCC 7327]AFY77972.1 Protein of unknown function (DUF3038) [Pleurocapsa sp. PCC 7327]MBF2019199.1 DUF3038 domain-containing protein [Hydrococcus sp. C42_A2020_068]
MSPSTTIMSDSNSPVDAKPHILNILPDFPIIGQQSAIRIQQKIDLILLAIEALELGASEQFLATAKQLDLQGIIKNRIVLWRLRCTNPWRRSYLRNSLTLEQAKALVIIASYRAKQLIVPIRNLLLAEQQMRDKGLPLDNHFLLSEYLEQFRSHFRSRMNPRRAKVAVYLGWEDELNELALSLLHQLIFFTGTMGMQRFWISLFDGEVA